MRPSSVERPLPLLNVARSLLPPQVLWFQPPKESLFGGGEIQRVEGEMRWTIDGVTYVGTIRTNTERATIIIDWAREGSTT